MGFEEAVVAVGRAVEGAGVAAILIGVLVATIGAAGRLGTPGVYARYRRDLGRALLLGLELLVAGDIIRTVTTKPSLEDVLVLAIIVLVRTFLGFSIELEVDGRLPWQKRRDPSTVGDARASGGAPSGALPAGA